MYDQTRQYRCTIIRGKAQKDMDNLLPAYATVLNDICPLVFIAENVKGLMTLYGGKIFKKIVSAHSDIHGRLVDVEIEGPFVYGIYEDGQKLNIGEMDFYKHK